jgi:hypothetical protein
VLLNFDHEFAAVPGFYGQCVVNVRKFLYGILSVQIKMHIDHRTDYL